LIRSGYESKNTQNLLCKISLLSGTQYIDQELDIVYYDRQTSIKLLSYFLSSLSSLYFTLSSFVLTEEAKLILKIHFQTTLVQKIS